MSRSYNNPQSYQKKPVCVKTGITNASTLGEQNLPNHDSKDI